DSAAAAREALEYFWEIQWPEAVFPEVLELDKMNLAAAAVVEGESGMDDRKVLSMTTEEGMTTGERVVIVSESNPLMALLRRTRTGWSPRKRSQIVLELEGKGRRGMLSPDCAAWLRENRAELW